MKTKGQRFRCVRSVPYTVGSTAATTYNHGGHDWFGCSSEHDAASTGNRGVVMQSPIFLGIWASRSLTRVPELRSTGDHDKNSVEITRHHLLLNIKAKRDKKQCTPEQH